MERTYPLAFIQPLAEDLAQLLAPAYQRIHIAGSIRRQSSQVHDIDLVVWACYRQVTAPTLFGDAEPLPVGPDALVNAIRALMVDLKPPPVDVRILRFQWRDIPVEVYLTEPDGSNWGALLQMRTGSRNFNRWIVRRCQDRQYHYKAGHGIYRDEACTDRIDDDTEPGIFRCLGLSDVPPIRRS